VNLTWAPPDDDGGRPLLRYDVYVKTTSGWSFAHSKTPEQRFYYASVMPFLEYHYRVVAVNAWGVSDGVEACTRGAPWPEEVIAGCEVPIENPEVRI
jgi:hypothetical protein